MIIHVKRMTAMTDLIKIQIKVQKLRQYIINEGVDGWLLQQCVDMLQEMYDRLDGAIRAESTESTQKTS